MKTTVNNIDLKKKMTYEEMKELFQSTDYFELSNEGDVVLVGNSPYQILHRGRNYEKAILGGGSYEDYCFVKYLLKPADLLSDIPMIVTKSNHECIHSMDELDKYWDKEIENAEYNLNRCKSQKEHAIKNGNEYGLPKHTPHYLTNKTSLSDLNNIIYREDGDKICATFTDFVNLSESPSGFGKTEKKAKKNLLNNMVKGKQKNS